MREKLFFDEKRSLRMIVIESDKEEVKKWNNR